MTFAKLSSKGQVVIPSQIRRRLKLRKGSHILIEEKGDLVILRAVSRQFFAERAGILGTKGRLLKDLLAERAKERLREDSR